MGFKCSRNRVVLRALTVHESEGLGKKLRDNVEAARDTIPRLAVEKTEEKKKNRK